MAGIQDILGGMAGGPPVGPGGPMGAPPMGGPMDRPTPGDQPDENDNTAQLANVAITALNKWMQAEKDPQERAQVSALLAKAHQLQAQEAKEADAAMGVSPAQKMIRRAVNRGVIPGGPGGGGGGAY